MWISQFVLRRIELTMFQRFGVTMLIEAAVLLLMLAWWFISRRTSWAERLGGLVGIIAVNVAGGVLADHTMHGMVWVITTVPAVLTAWAIWWALARKSRPAVRTGGLIAAVALVCGVYALVRMDGVGGEQQMSLHWRWTPTAEQRFLASRAALVSQASPAPVESMTTTAVVVRADDWPAFRGPGRDAVMRGVQIATDWNTKPPRLAWREPLGPGWSSPVSAGGRVFTQEQRGADEVVVCRDAGTGSEQWVHADRVRFEESLSGAGPRATPTVADGLIYTFGATGMLDCLDAASGRVKWSRNVGAETGVKPPMWGFASSPLVDRGLVIVYVGGSKGLLAYKADSGEPAWSVRAGEQSYASAEPATLDGVYQVLFLSDRGLHAIDPSAGRQLWEHVIPAPGAPRAIQPHVISGSGVLVSSETDLGTALLDVSRDGADWKSRRQWVTRALKPSFNDFVVRDGHAYGFDGAIFCCTNLADGKRCWREGSYGHGQVLLLEPQGLLLIVGETGDVVLLRASAAHNEELARFHALSGKTWSYPALAGTRLTVRSEEELACYDLVP